MNPYVTSLTFIIGFIFGLVLLYALVKTVTVAVLDAKARVNERERKDGKE